MINRFKDYSDGTIKTVNISSKGVIEMSLLMNKSFDVVCVPSYYFCNMGCVMCHLTNNKLNKPMIKIDIDEFLYTLFESLTDSSNNKRTNKDKLLISFMGVGEPILNLELLKMLKLNEYKIKDRFNYKSISYAMSTMMPINNIDNLIELVNGLNISLKLHFSMHNPIDIERLKLIPNTKVDVETSLKLLNKYKKSIKNNKTIMNEYIKFHRTNNPVEIHYTLIKDINDKEEELNRLIELENKYKIPIKFIKFNPKDKLKISLKEDIWVNSLKAIVRVKTYSPPGKEVGSSCGEFTRHYYHEQIESKKDKDEFLLWKEKHQIFD